MFAARRFVCWHGGAWECQELSQGTGMRKSASNLGMGTWTRRRTHKCFHTEPEHGFHGLIYLCWVRLWAIWTCGWHPCHGRRWFDGFQGSFHPKSLPDSVICDPGSSPEQLIGSLAFQPCSFPLTWAEPWAQDEGGESMGAPHSQRFGGQDGALSLPELRASCHYNK